MIKLLSLLLLMISCANLRNKSSYDRELSGYKYPFSVKRRTFHSQKQELHMAYMDINSKGDKVAVLLHGKNFAGFYWKQIALELQAAGYRVIIPDQIGFGKSSKPRNYQFSFYAMAAQTKDLLNDLGIKKAMIIGHSMGGMLATHFTYSYPDCVSKMILINPIGLEPYLKYVEFKDPEFFFKNELAKTPAKAKAYQQKNYYDGKWDKKYDHLLEPYNKQMKGRDWEIVAWNNALTYGPIFNEDITTKFSSIENPVVLIIGTRDKTGPGRGWKKPGVKRVLGDYKKLGKLAQKSFMNAKLYELPGLGHMPHFEDYNRFLPVFKKAIK